MPAFSGKLRLLYKRKEIKPSNSAVFETDEQMTAREKGNKPKET